MPPLAAAAAPLLAGPIGGAISSIAGSIGSVSGVLGGAAGQAAAGIGSGMFGKDVIGSLEKAFENTFKGLEAFQRPLHEGKSAGPKNEGDDSIKQTKKSGLRSSGRGSGAVMASSVCGLNP